MVTSSWLKVSFSLAACYTESWHVVCLKYTALFCYRVCLMGDLYNVP